MTLHVQCTNRELRLPISIVRIDVRHIMELIRVVKYTCEHVLRNSRVRNLVYTRARIWVYTAIICTLLDRYEDVYLKYLLKIHGD